MTETATVISSTQHADNYPGSCGNLLCGVEAKIINSSDGSEIFEYDKPGELVVRSPSVTVRGYYANDAASAETFTPDGWVRTGDEVVMRKSERGGEHLFVVDRIKELIKTKVFYLSNPLFFPGQNTIKSNRENIYFTSDLTFTMQYIESHL